MIGVTTPDGTVISPASSLSSGSYYGAQTVVLSSETLGASIYYTLDGSTPSESSLPYSSPITISSSTMIKAIAQASGMTDSDVSVIDLTIIGESGDAIGNVVPNPPVNKHVAWTHENLAAA